MPFRDRFSVVWTPLLAWHAGTVVVLIALDLVLGGRSTSPFSGFFTFLLVLTAIPWSALALPAYGTTFALLLYAGALGNLALHAWYVGREDEG